MSSSTSPREMKTSHFDITHCVYPSGRGTLSQSQGSGNCCTTKKVAGRWFGWSFATKVLFNVGIGKEEKGRFLSREGCVGNKLLGRKEVKHAMRVIIL